MKHDFRLTDFDLPRLLRSTADTLEQHYPACAVESIKITLGKPFVIDLTVEGEYQALQKRSGHLVANESSD